MNLKTTLSIVGILIIIDGFVSLVIGKSLSRGVIHHITFTDSIIEILTGVIFLIISKKIKRVCEFTKCPECKKCYGISELNNRICPRCTVLTIDLDKYFKKYPNEKPSTNPE